MIASTPAAWIGLLSVALGALVASANVTLAAPVTLTELGAGTLAVPFTTLNAAYHQAHPAVTIQAQFGGSVKMARQITELGQPTDVLAVADYRVIPTLLSATPEGRAPLADWYVGFAANAITFVYTPKSKGADRITAANWYEVLAEPGVQIGRSNPDTDPSGYQTLQMLQLAERYYRRPGLAQAILANAPQTNMRDTETALIGALEAGQIDYLAIYRSDAIQHHFAYLTLPPQIDLSDPSLAAAYAQATVTTQSGQLAGAPIIYALTIPADAPHPQAAAALVAFILGPTGRATLQQDGFVVLAAPIASGLDKLPANLHPLVQPWPATPAP